MPRSPDLVPWKDPRRKTKPWRISIPPKLSDTGKRQRRFFKSKTEAASALKKIKVRQENHGTAAKLLSPADELQAVSAFKLLREFGSDAQLSEIVGAYLDGLRERKMSKTLSDAWDAYLSRTDKKISPVHEKNLKATQKRLSAIHDKPVCDLSGREIDDCLNGASPAYRNAMLREIRAVLNWCMGGTRKWLSRNPAEDCEFSKAKKIGEVQIYSVDQAKKIMEAGAKLHPEIVPALAMMLFAGVRPDQDDGEITKLEWGHVLHTDRHHKRLELPGSITKTGKQRSIKIRPALLSWIQWHVKRLEQLVPASKKKVSLAGVVCPEKGTVLRGKLRDVFDEAGVERIQDGFRHTFASYLAPIDGLDAVETELGHLGGREVLNRHYRTDVRKPVAKKFWALRAN